MVNTSAGEKVGRRYFALDALRGLIIILMALDHANYFVAQRHSAGEYWGGPFPAYESALPFLTRLLTHLAAPGFFFLMGVGMMLFARSRRQAGWTIWAVRRHSWLRGLLLILLQFLLVNVAWSLSPGGWVLDVYVGVLFALGGGMIIGSFLLGLDGRLLVLITAVLLLVSQLIVPEPQLWNQVPAALFEKLLFWPGGSTAVWSNYPILPWLPYVTFGLACAAFALLFNKPRRSLSLWLGLGFLALFFLLRLLGEPGSIRPPAGEGWIPFFNLVKYPPSFTFFLLTMGLNLLLLTLFSLAGSRAQRWLQPLVIYGRVPLFFYVAHLFLYAALGHLITPQGTSIPRMLPIWFAGLLLLYPFCLWYGRFKQSRPPNSLWRFF